MFQNLKLKGDAKITFKQGYYDVEKQEIELHFPYTGDNNRFIEQNSNGFDLHKEKVCIQFEWDNQQFSAYLFSLVRENTILDGTSPVHHTIFRVCDVKCKEDIPDECRLLFFIPNVKFHMRLGIPRRNASFGGETDRTPFVYNNRQWQFRKAYYVSDSKKTPYPYDLIETNNKQQVGIFLETIKTSSEDIDAIEVDAKEICTLASLAQGCHSCWKTLWYIQNSEIKLCNYSNLVTNDFNNSKPTIVLNEYDCSDPCEFIQNAETEYKQNPEWWRLTIVWYVNGRIYNVIEINKMIESMLFDRITAKIFSIITYEALNEDLTAIKPSEFKKKIHNPLIGKTNNPNVQSVEDKDFLGMCRIWLQGDAYIGKIKAILTYIGVTIGSNEEQELLKRHDIMHRGELLESLDKVMEYDDRISKLCLLLILPLLGYGGTFITRNKHYNVATEAPQWERLRLSLIQEKAQRLLK